jgi:two-component system OmpR family response regulator
VHTDSVKVLLVEDEVKMARLMVAGLTEEGFAVDVASTGFDAVWHATEQEYDAIVLDVMLPDLDGFDVCRRIRETDRVTPILMLTARDAVPDRVAGLEAGADDYVTKPFAFDEVLARLHALGRRGRVERSELVSAAGLRLDVRQRRVWRGETEIELSQRAFAVLEALMRRAGRVLSREELVHLAWDRALEPRSNVVDVCIKGLRERVDRPFGTASIQTVRGVGYRVPSTRAP